MFIERSMVRKVLTIGPDRAILEARDLMHRAEVHSLPVVDEDNRLLGIVTDRDVRSALPSICLSEDEVSRQRDRVARLKVRDIMTQDPVTVVPEQTLQDALVLVLQLHVGALPVVDREKRVVGIVSLRDILGALVEVLGIKEPGVLLCIVAKDRQGQMKAIVDAITEEGIRTGSILVATHWEEGKRAFFPYLLTKNVGRVKKKLEGLGFTLVNPADWYMAHAAKGRKEER